jgi:hypothetical protein
MEAHARKEWRRGVEGCVKRVRKEQSPWIPAAQRRVGWLFASFAGTHKPCKMGEKGSK